MKIKNLNSLLVIALCLLLGGCSAKSLVGEYEYRSADVTHKLMINQDNTFTYQTVGHLNSETRGNWQADNSILHLLSSNTYTPYRVEEGDSSNLESVIIRFVGKDQSLIPNIRIFLNSDFTKMYFSDGGQAIVISNKDKAFKELYIVSDLARYTYIRQRAQSNIFIITYDSEKENLWYLDEKLSHKSNRLEGKYGLVFRKK